MAKGPEVAVTAPVWRSFVQLLTGSLCMLMVVAEPNFLTLDSQGHLHSIPRHGRQDDRSWGQGGDCTDIIRWAVMRFEGWHRCAYDSGRGYRAVGAGFDLDDEPGFARGTIESVVGAAYDEVYSGKRCLHDTEIDELLRASIAHHEEAINKDGIKIYSLCCPVQAALVDIWFSFKPGSTFSSDIGGHFVEAVNSQEWDAAFNSLISSSWCKGDGGRCALDSAKVHVGCP